MARDARKRASEGALIRATILNLTPVRLTLMGHGAMLERYHRARDRADLTGQMREILYRNQEVKEFVAHEPLKKVRAQPKLRALDLDGDRSGFAAVRHRCIGRRRGWFC